MIENDEQQPHICYECDSEFVIHTPYTPLSPISFCPFCGSEMETNDEEFDEDDDEEDLFK